VAIGCRSWRNKDASLGDTRRGVEHRGVRATSPHRVLVVDDERLFNWSVAETLTDEGDVVTEAGTGQEALNALQIAPEPDVVLLDYRLPDSRDFGLLESVRRLAPRSRVILMTADYAPELEQQALARGAYRVVGKPLDMGEIPALVHEAAESRCR
jgi:DNA-binding NtrC family response regulator